MAEVQSSAGAVYMITFSMCPLSARKRTKRMANRTSIADPLQSVEIFKSRRSTWSSPETWSAAERISGETICYIKFLLPLCTQSCMYLKIVYIALTIAVASGTSSK